MTGLFRGQHPVNDSFRHHPHNLVRNTVMLSIFAAATNDLPFLQSLKSPLVRGDHALRSGHIAYEYNFYLPQALRIM